MPIENSKTVVKTKSGRANHAKLAEENRLPTVIAKDGTVFDPNPNPKEEIQGKLVSRGYARNSDGVWRAGFSPEQYHDMVELSAKRKAMGKDWDFLPELYEAELEDYNKWLKAKTPKKDA